MAKKQKSVSGTAEWAKSNANCMDGCSNNCLYCYAKTTAIQRTKRKTADTWKDETLRASVAGKGYGKRKGTIMFPTMHDITKGNIEHCEKMIRGLLKVGNSLLVVSKPDPDVIARLCHSIQMQDEEMARSREGLAMTSRDRVLFRFTIGSRDNDVLRFWEPNAPSYEERLYSLMMCFKNGWRTSVSMEPMLDCKRREVVEQVEALAPYLTDAIWLGKMNRPGSRLAVNCGGTVPPNVQKAMDELIAAWSDENIVRLHGTLKSHPKVKWKESIKKIVGIEVQTEAGMDV